MKNTFTDYEAGWILQRYPGTPVRGWRGDSRVQCRICHQRMVVGQRYLAPLLTSRARNEVIHFDCFSVAWQQRGLKSLSISISRQRAQIVRREKLLRESVAWMRRLRDLRKAAKVWCDKAKRKGRKPIITPCPWCRIDFSASELRVHLPRCPQKGKED